MHGRTDAVNDYLRHMYRKKQATTDMLTVQDEILKMSFLGGHQLRGPLYSGPRKPLTSHSCLFLVGFSIQAVRGSKHVFGVRELGPAAADS